jgi:hypothetical protein
MFSLVWLVNYRGEMTWVTYAKIKLPLCLTKYHAMMYQLLN